MIDRSDLSDADSRAFVGRLDDERQSQLGHDRPPIRLRINDAIAWRGDPGGNPDQFGAPLVHRQRGSHDTAAGIRDAKHLERALHRSVFTEAAVQRDEYSIEALALELEDGALSRIERVCVHTAFAQRLQDRVARKERDLAFSGWAAHQYCDLPELAHAGPRLSPMILTSGSSTTPVFSATTRCTCSIKASISDAVARRSGLTMKLACFSDTRAPPIAWPLSPALSISRAA